MAKTPAPKPVKPAPVAAHPGPHTAQSVPFGVYVGSGDPSGVASFAAATGTHPTYASDYLPTDEGWAGISNDNTVTWIADQWRGSGYTLVLGVPIIPTDNNGNAQGTLAAGAAGQYNSSYVTLADTLVSSGAPNAVLRLGWEFNGSWYPWQVTDATDAANFAAYFRNIVTSMRSVPGQSFKFVWNPNVGDSFGAAYTPAQAYPGSAYVDYVGIDMYDEGWSTPPTPQNAWANQLSQSWGLDWLAGFSAAEGRPVVIPEWGIGTTGDGHGMGDDPYFITQVANVDRGEQRGVDELLQLRRVRLFARSARRTVQFVVGGVSRHIRLIASRIVASPLSKFGVMRADNKSEGIHSVTV